MPRDNRCNAFSVFFAPPYRHSAEIMSSKSENKSSPVLVFFELDGYTSQMLPQWATVPCDVAGSENKVADSQSMSCMFEPRVQVMNLALALGAWVACGPAPLLPVAKLRHRVPEQFTLISVARWSKSDQLFVSNENINISPADSWVRLFDDLLFDKSFP